MKRMFALLLCLVLLLAGCSRQPVPTEVPETTEVPTTVLPTTVEPTETEPPVPETAAATALVDKAYIVLLTLDRDAEVEIVGEFDETYYVIKTENGYGLIEKQLVRMDGEAAYEGWTGYAQHNVKLHSSYHLDDAEPELLTMNTELTVLDAFGDCLVVQHGEKIGYILAKDVSTYYIQPSAGGGGGGGGTGADGGDISLGNMGGIVRLSTFVPQSGEVIGKAKILVNVAEVILGWFDRDDAMEIVIEEGFAESKEGYHTVYVNGLYGYVKQIFALKEGDTPFASWDGYAHVNAPVYDNYYLTGEPVSKLGANAEIKILLDLGNCYLVSIGGDFGYMSKDVVSDSYIDYSYNSGGGGGNSGGEWTPPAL